MTECSAQGACTAGILQLRAPFLHGQCCGLQGTVLCNRNSRLVLAVLYMANVWYCRDNTHCLQMNYNSMRGMMDERAAICSSNSSVCPPVSWTISNRLATLAPFVLRWHYR